MGDLGIDMAISEVGPGRFTATLSADWEIWGPNGGYLAAAAMRAADGQLTATGGSTLLCRPAARRPDGRGA